MVRFDIGEANYKMLPVVYDIYHIQLLGHIKILGTMPFPNQSLSEKRAEIRLWFLQAALCV